MCFFMLVLKATTEAFSALTGQLGVNGEEDIKEGVWRIPRRKQKRQKKTRRVEERQVKGVLEKWECGEVGRRWSQYLKMDLTERKQQKKSTTITSAAERHSPQIPL